jgi:hypothetical protein
MLTGIHILLTYACPFSCDHCFLYCSPQSPGTFTIEAVRKLVDQASDVGSITSISFEGGEPLLFLPTLLSGIRYAKGKEFTTGVVTNGYSAQSPDDAEMLLQMLMDSGLDSLTISEDELHYGSLEVTPARHLMDAAESIGFSARILSVELPSSESPTGGVMFRGRAADKMVESVPRQPWKSFNQCPHENPLDPARVHIDSYGNVHFCQGISIGNIWETPLSTLVAEVNLSGHTVCGALSGGGPAELASRFDFQPEADYIDACHLCFEARRANLETYPEVLTPPQVYGR